MLTLRLLHHRSSPRWTVRTDVLPTTLNAHATSARAILTLALGARGVMEIVDSLDSPWRGLVETLLLALLALGFFAAAQRSYDQHVGWLLSGSIAAGLAASAFYNFINAGATSAAPAAASGAFIAIFLFVVRGRHPIRFMTALPKSSRSVEKRGIPRP
jgi:hypothetical protein